MPLFSFITNLKGCFENLTPSPFILTPPPPRLLNLTKNSNLPVYFDHTFSRHLRVHCLCQFVIKYILENAKICLDHSKSIVQAFEGSTAWKMFVFGVCLVCIFPYSDWIRRDTEYLSVFSPKAGKYGPEKLRIRTFFT